MPCASASAAAEEVRTWPLDGEIEFIKENEPPAAQQVGVRLKPASGTLSAAFEYGGKAVTVGGSVIGPVTALDKMGSTFKLKATATAGKQAPEEFEGGVKETLTLNFGSGSQQAGLATSATNANEEKLEIKAVP